MMYLWCVISLCGRTYQTETAMWGDMFYSATITLVPQVTLVLHGLLPLHPLYNIHGLLHNTWHGGVYVPCMPGESYCRRLRSLLLYLCDVFWALINSLVCWVLSGSFHTPQVRDTSRSGLSDLYFTIPPLFSTYFLRQTLVSPWQSPPLAHITCYNHWLFYVTFSKHWTRKQPLAQPKTCKCLSSPSHFSSFNCCLSVVL